MSRRVSLALLATLLAATTLALAPAATADPPIDAADWPRLDGSTATIPLGQAFQDAFRDGDPEPVTFNKTDQAYHNLVDGLADLILVTQPSDDELAYAAANGVELEVIPVVKEGFVFLTNTGNPVQSLTVEQLRAIYAGQIQNWSEVGGPDGKITAYQRPSGSGSQTGMEELVMQGTPMMDPPVNTQVPMTMSDLVDALMSFEYGYALGYSYYYYVTEMYGDLATNPGSARIRLMDVDGVAPTAANIRSGAYPLTDAYYIVIRADEPAGGSVREVVDAMLSDEGQLIAQGAGYVALRDVGDTPTDPLGATVDDTYSENPITITKWGEGYSLYNGNCTYVERLSIDGLADQAAEDALNARIRAIQDDYLGDAVPVAECNRNPLASDGHIGDMNTLVILATVTANFGNVLSVEGREYYAYGSYGVYEINLRLDTGADIVFDDLYTSPAAADRAIVQAAEWQTFQLSDSQKAAIVAKFRAEPRFTFSPAGARVYLAVPLQGSSGTRIGFYEVDFRDHLGSVAIFKRYAGATGIFEDDPVPTCPVLTVLTTWSVRPGETFCGPSGDSVSIARSSGTSVSSAGGSGDIVVRATQVWANSATTQPPDCPWVTWTVNGEPVSGLYIGGAGDSALGFTAEPNTGTASRYCYLTLSAPGDYVVTTLIQAAAISISTTAATADPAGASLYIYIYGDQDWTVTEWPDWAIPSRTSGSPQPTGGTVNNHLEITAEANNTGQTRVGELIFTPEVGNPVTYTITQDPIERDWTDVLRDFMARIRTLLQRIVHAFGGD